MDGISQVLTHGTTPERAAAQPSLPPFARVLVEFVGDLSRRLMASATVRQHPELVALAFWMRAANVRRMGDALRDRLGDLVVLPRGLVFHIAPSNVDTIFVYSWVLSLLCGNRNVVRLSSRTSPQIERLLEAIDNTLADARFGEVAGRVAIVRYEHSEVITASLSALADTRVIWGGDNTVAAIRRVPLPATANEVAFANKLSLAVIDTGFWREADADARQQVARRFANDAYWFGQAACSSPRALLWLGERPAPQDTQSFWTEVRRAIDGIPGEFGAIDFVNKLVSADLVAAEIEACVASDEDNRLTRVQISADALGAVMARDVHCGAGLFFESYIDDLEALRPALSRRIQTLCTAGIAPEALRDFITRAPCAGIDRIVPMGQALDFAHVWDGFDFFDVLLRKVSIARE